MALNYIEKGSGLHREIRAAGLRLQWREGSGWDYDLTDEAAIQAIMDNYDPIADAILDKKAEIKKEAAKRAGDFIIFFKKIDDVQAQFGYELMNLFFQQDQYLDPGAKGADAEWEGVLAVRVAAKDAMNAVGAMVDINLAIAYDVVNTPSWPV